MKIQFFKSGYKPYPGIEITHRKYAFRCGGGQFSFWKDCEAIFNFLF